MNRAYSSSGSMPHSPTSFLRFVHARSKSLEHFSPYNKWKEILVRQKTTTPTDYYNTQSRSQGYRRLNLDIRRWNTQRWVSSTIEQVYHKVQDLEENSFITSLLPTKCKMSTEGSWYLELVENRPCIASVTHSVVDPPWDSTHMGDGLQHSINSSLA